MILSTTFHPQIDGKEEHTIYTLDNMLRACVIEFKGSWVDQLPLIKFGYDNNYHLIIQIAPFKNLYGRRCRSLIGWLEVGETVLFGPYLVYESKEKLKVVAKSLYRCEVERIRV